MWRSGRRGSISFRIWGSPAFACFALIKRSQMAEDLVKRTTDFYCICLERVLLKALNGPSLEDKFDIC
ncbi:MAG: hypothetical protein JRJ23_07415 [Deltaproteobacteria bacterium]|nr:hypothetical protein [Deltaproteobacteria bacterium]